MGGKIVWAVCLLQLLATPAAAARGLDVSTKGDIDNKAKGGVDEASLGDEKPKFFWYNHVSGESSWFDPLPSAHTDDEGNKFFQDPFNHSHTWWESEAPEEYAWVKVPGQPGGEHEGRDYFHNKVTDEVSWEEPKMLAWRKMATDRVFYYNQVTGESTHDRPEAMGYWSDEHNRTFWLDENGEATWESKYWWTKVPVEGEEDKFYYVNEMTKETSWELPKDAAWVLWHEEL